ncbi:MAG: divalent-cation tolerance protein CutA [Azoarcus sp.]|jgi:periplasmic divalent cation tolerance protein|nr:divalent-cation tolerance protein CutA [Azoarcus sp.]
MNPETEVLLVLTALPDRASADVLAARLVEESLAACVNILAPCGSVYRWRGKVETAAEIPLLIKTTRTCYPALEAAVQALHPYEVPELIALPVTRGLDAYLDWVAASVTMPNPAPPALP